MKADHHKGIHHVTAVAGRPQRNYNFYARLLGLKLVKKTVNFDDPSAYHLYYGNDTGEPGSLLSFFCYPRAARGEPDTGQAIAVSLSIPTRSVDFWTNYLHEEGVEYVKPFERLGKRVIGLQDPDGLHLELVADPAANELEGWNAEPIPAQHAIRGLHGIALAEENAQPTGQLLTEFLGFDEIEEEHDRILYQTPGSLGSVVEIIDDARLEGEEGRGAIHHVAFRARDDDEQQEISRHLAEEGYEVTDVYDRHYFHSIYFHEPGGVLFELSTDMPGFTIDELPESLGGELKLPPELEGDRKLIEADLPTLDTRR